MTPAEIARANAFYDAHGALWGIIQGAGLHNGDRWTGGCYATHLEAHKDKRADWDREEAERLGIDIARWDREGEFWTYDY